jgi:hypothetical protein
MLAGGVIKRAGGLSWTRVSEKTSFFIQVPKKIQFFSGFSKKRINTRKFTTVKRIRMAPKKIVPEKSTAAQSPSGYNPDKGYKVESVLSADDRQLGILPKDGRGRQCLLSFYGESREYRIVINVSCPMMHDTDN